MWAHKHFNGCGGGSAQFRITAVLLDQHRSVDDVTPVDGTLRETPLQISRGGRLVCKTCLIDQGGLYVKYGS